jgi:3D (Asp-Asp-Asp) domain-containing protein
MPEKKSKSWTLRRLGVNVLSILVLLLISADSASARDEIKLRVSRVKQVQVLPENQPATKPVEMYVRSTNYHRGEARSDADTENGKTASLVNIDTAHALGLGVVAVDPKVIPYGSKVVAPDGKVYIALDTGSAVVSRAAARKLASIQKLSSNSPEAKAPVLDFYSYRQVGEPWDHVKVIPYTGQTPFKKLKHSEKLAYLKQSKVIVSRVLRTST